MLLPLSLLLLLLLLQHSFDSKHAFVHGLSLPIKRDNFLLEREST